MKQIYSSKKILSLIVIGLLIVAYYFFVINRVDDSQANTTTKTSDITEDGKSNQNVNTEGNTNNESDSETGESVTVSPAPSESLTKPFPIENSHYKIEQLDETHYRITLFAIINSPSQYDEYRAQLKQFKQESLAYLGKRLGTTDNLSIIWNPQDAAVL